MSNSQAMGRPWLARRMTAMVVLALLLVSAALYRAIEQPQRQAARFLGQVQGLQVGQTAYSQVRQLVAEYPGQSRCYENDCSVRFDNAWLHRLGLAPVTQLQVMLHRSESRLSGINMAMMVAGASLQQPPRAAAMVFVAPHRDSGPAWRAVITDDAQGHPVKTFVQMSPQAPAPQRNAAFAFNLGCLTRWRGCATSRDLLPGVWQNASRIEWEQ